MLGYVGWIRGRRCLAGGVMLVALALGAAIRAEGPNGACCFDDGSCTETTEFGCTVLQGGSFQGVGTTCGAQTCLGACCIYAGGCSITTAAACKDLFAGFGTTCPGACYGACCTFVGTCVEIDEYLCESEHSGTFFGLGTECAGFECALGACCMADGTCVVQSGVICSAMGGEFQGASTACTGNTCLGACCVAGGCVLVAIDDCFGAFQGHGTDCSACIGACCLPDDTCTETGEYDCQSFRLGSFAGLGSTCAETDCAPGACCLCDGSCLETSQVGCVSLGGIMFAGPGTACASFECPLPGDVLDQVQIGNNLGGFPGGMLAEGGHFGVAIAAIGDVNGDGIGDLAVGARDAPGAGGVPEAGEVWILFMAADGTVAGEAVIDDDQSGVTGPNLLGFDHFGAAVAGIGDLNGDGVPDIAVGAPGDNFAGPNVGAIYVLLLTASGGVVDLQKITEGVGGFGGQLDDNGQFGWALALIGSVGEGGFGGLLVGAPNGLQPVTMNTTGEVWAVDLDANGLVTSWWAIDPFVVLDLAENERFGSAIADVGDLDGDGDRDLAIGSPGSGFSMGMVRLVYMEGCCAAAWANLGPVPLDSGDQFGSSIALLRDLDGNGMPEFAVGAPGDDDGGTNAGAVWILLQEVDQTIILPPRKISDTQGSFGGAVDLPPFASFGSSLASLRDLDGNGVDDLAVGADEVIALEPLGSGYGSIWILFLDGVSDVTFEESEFPAAGGAITEDVGNLDTAGGVGAGAATTDVVIVIPAGIPILDGAIQVFRNLGTSGGGWLGLVPNAPVTVGVSPASVAIGHLDGDAFADVAVANAGDDNVMLLFNDGSGQAGFDAPVIVPVGNDPRAVAAADLTMDGDSDLVVANTGDDEVVILEGDGAGGFVEVIALPAEDQPCSVDPGDLDNDKDTDLVIGRFGSDGVTVLRFGGGKVEMSFALPAGDGPVDLALGDLDGNDLIDVVTADRDGDTVSIILNNGDFTFLPAISLPVGDQPISVDATDLDGDGDVDLAVVATDLVLGPVLQVVESHLADGGFLVFAPPVSIPIGAEPSFVVSADFDDNGLSDLVTSNFDDDQPGGGSVTVLLGVDPAAVACPGDIDGNGAVGFLDLLAILSAWGNCIACPEDLNGDFFVNFEDLLIALSGWGTCEP